MARDRTPEETRIAQRWGLEAAVDSWARIIDDLLVRHRVDDPRAAHLPLRGARGCAGRVPVLVDGGFRRGTDILKAMALGASAICIGRPYLWRLAAFAQAGVEAVLEILRRELQIIMRQVGMPTLAGITAKRVVERTR